MSLWLKIFPCLEKKWEKKFPVIICLCLFLSYQLHWQRPRIDMIKIKFQMPMYSYQSAARVISCRRDVCLDARNCRSKTMAASPRTCVGSWRPRGLDRQTYDPFCWPFKTPFHPPHWPTARSSVEKILRKASTHWHSHSDCILSDQNYSEFFDWQDLSNA